MGYTVPFQYTPFDTHVAPLGLWVCGDSTLLYTYRPAGALATGRSRFIFRRRNVERSEIPIHRGRFSKIDLQEGNHKGCPYRNRLNVGARSCACPKHRQPPEYRATTSFLIPIHRGVAPTEVRNCLKTSLLHCFLCFLEFLFGECSPFLQLLVSEVWCLPLRPRQF